MINALIDTNIILDSLAARKPFSDEANAIFDLIKNDEVTGFISASSVTDIYYLLRKAIGYESSILLLENLLNAFEIISVTKADCLNALKSTIKDYEDALVAECANKANIDFIVTRDNKFLNYPKAITPSAFLNQFYN
jgi:predicted nucleic acid-binding protein